MNCIFTWVGKTSRFSSAPPPRTTIKAVHQNTLCSGQLAGDPSHHEGRSLVTKPQAGGAGWRDFDITEIDITDSDITEFDITDNDIPESDITEIDITRKGKLI